MLSEIVQGIQIIKFFSWESKFIEQINILREEELKSVKLFLLVQTCSNVLWGSMQSLLGISAFLIYTARGEILTVDKAFLTISLLNIMLIPLIIFPICVGLTIGAVVATGRINSYFLSPEINRGERYYFLSFYISFFFLFEYFLSPEINRGERYYFLSFYIVTCNV
jgi:hypothetical protein